MERVAALPFGVTSAFALATGCWAVWGWLTPGDFFANGSPLLFPSLLVAIGAGALLGCKLRRPWQRALLGVATAAAICFHVFVPGGWWVTPPPGLATAVGADHAPIDVPLLKADDGKLHRDEDIRRLAKHDIDEVSKRGDIMAVPWLEVVPAGETKRRGDVFGALGLDEEKVRDFRVVVVRFRGLVTFMAWQVSPSYDLVCMTGIMNRDMVKDPKKWDFDSVDRKIYGVRLVSRAESERLLRPIGYYLIR